MRRMHAANGQDVYPQRVQLELFIIEIELQVMDKSRDMFVESLHKVLEDRKAPGQIVQRGVARIAEIAIFLAPFLSCIVIVGNRQTGRFKL